MMKKIDPILLAIIVIVIIIIGGVFSVADFSGDTDIAKYQTDTEEKPKIELSENTFDFGAINVQDIKTKDVKIKNSGQKSLVLSGFTTSCNCTFVQLIQGDKESPRFSMHYTDPWQAEISPGEKAIVRVIYQPNLMPVQGSVSRSVVFKTNDPDNPSVNISFTANVK